MRYLFIILLLATGIAHAQNDAPTKPFIAASQKTDFLKNIHAIELDHKDLTLNFPSKEQVMEISYQSDFQFILPTNINMVSYPSTDLSNLSGFFLGNYTTQSVQIGNKIFQSTYIFDTNGVLRSSELSIPIGHKN